MTIVKRALVSVSNKSGIVDFCKGLSKLGIEILSTGGTAKLLTENNIDVIEVSDYTNFPEMMGGRIKTLHPKIHGGLLARRGVDDAVMEEHSIKTIDLVVVNLYPFEETASKTCCSFEEAIENIDIGGPAMLRSAAKNHNSVTAVVNSEDYNSVLDELKSNGSICDETRFNLAQKVFSHTANYDANVSNYLGGFNSKKEQLNYPQTFTSQFIKKQDLRYGENPHQTGAFYSEPNPMMGTLASARQIQGKELSYNNIADTDAAYECVKTFVEPACVIVKHANPCGIALGSSILEAYEKAFASDETSAFGGIIAFNRPLDEATASKIIANQFVEVIIAPGVTEDSQKILSGKENIRVLDTEVLGEQNNNPKLLSVAGGLLLQDSDIASLSAQDIKIVSEREPSEDEIQNCLFAWKVCKFVKSNAIVYTKDNQTIGIGAGQMSRIDSAQIAASKALERGFKTEGCSMASDAFFPFRDGIDAAAKIGITSVIQPGGSMRDQEVIDAANEAGMAMLFTGIRHFRH